ncbi:clostripain-related cysteine peptidase [Bdellovibrio sp. HCB274]|uniref:clostripain-related cysteine peptidase n=1 Tax=Bdellovibrio sp. HCB274 TaxID=3394361 RepID=UPI0039B4CBFE
MNHVLRVFTVCIFMLASSFAVAATQSVKEWNMLVFLNGNNNLDSFGPMNINQMEQLGSNDQVNVLVQWASASRDNVTRHLITKDSNTNTVTSPVVQNLGSVDMGDWKELVKFVDWANQNYPAKKYFIVVWNHGGGWHLLNVPGVIRPMDISWDDNTGNRITTEQLGQAMAESAKIIGHKVDVYSSDACLMGMVEVASEMSESVQYYLGSQDVEPGAGWPYATFLAKWFNNPAMTPAELVKVHAADYLAAYNGGVYGHRKVTMSAYDLSQLDTYEQSLKRMAEELQGLNDGDIFKVARSAKNAKLFTYWDYRDVIDFVDLISRNGITTPAMQSVRDAQNSFVIANSQNQDNRTYGVSIWLPTGASSSDYSGHIERYHGLKFNQRTGWANLVTKLQGK